MPLRVVVPITDWNERYNNADWMVKIVCNSLNNLSKDSSADCFQVKSVSTTGFNSKIGEIDEEVYQKIKQSLKNIFEL